jgi:hypothetical protein
MVKKLWLDENAPCGYSRGWSRGRMAKVKSDSSVRQNYLHGACTGFPKIFWWPKMSLGCCPKTSLSTVGCVILGEYYDLVSCYLWAHLKSCLYWSTHSMMIVFCKTMSLWQRHCWNNIMEEQLHRAATIWVSQILKEPLQHDALDIALAMEESLRVQSKHLTH